MADTASVQEKIQGTKEALQKITDELNKLCETLHSRRKAVLGKLTDELEGKLQDLGMASARFSIDLVPVDKFTVTGKDELNFLFSANKGGAFGEMKKVASGGELSRIMLVIKSILAAYDNLPTLMFDEIDTGVSGEVSAKMGSIMKQMSEHMQVFAITHLPQVAAQGKQQFKVYKQEVDQTTETQMKFLPHQERVQELATMLGGLASGDSALAHAQQLLQSNQ